METKEETKKHASNFKDLTGQRFGRLVAVRYQGYETPKGTSDSRNALWLCKCDCGNQTVVRGSHLRAGETSSCGCIIKKHGKCKTETYASWKGMLARCGNENNDRYMDYGGRGISVCDKWKTFNNFYQDMGDRPKGLTIERLDNSGNYEPGNCSWATHKEQSRNNRRNRIIEYKGDSMCISQWSEELGIKKETLLARINRGWSIERALTTRVGTYNGHQGSY